MAVNAKSLRDVREMTFDFADEIIDDFVTVWNNGCVCTSRGTKLTMRVDAYAPGRGTFIIDDTGEPC